MDLNIVAYADVQKMQFDYTFQQISVKGSLLYNGYRVFPGDKVRPGRAADHSSPF